MVYGITFLVAFGMASCLTPALKFISLKRNIVASPKKDRWHKAPKALLGGVGIVVSTLAAWQISAFWGVDYKAVVSPLWIVVAGGLGIFALGLIDDVFEINPQYKLVGQVVVTSSLVFLGIKASWFDSQIANILVSIFWIVGITNAFNLIDNMDGLSAGIAFIGGVFLFIWLAMMPGENALSAPLQLLIAAYLGSLVGFLIYNFNPASIFMGDAGSLFIGFMLACFTILGKPGYEGAGVLVNHATLIIIPCLILFIPILDVAFVSFMRKSAARSIFQGGKDHSSHRMVAVGLSERKTVLILYIFAIVSGIIALAVYPLSFGVSVVIVTIYLIFVLLFWLYLANVDVYAENPGIDVRRSFMIKPIFNESAYLRTFLSVLFDLILITVAYYTAYLLRFEGNIGADFSRFLKSLPILFACQILCFYAFGVYQRLWWGSRLGDMGAYVKGVTTGTVMAVLVLLFLYRFQSFSRTVFVIYWGVMLILVSFSRFSFRMLDEWLSQENRNGRPTLIYGAGVGGQMVAREIETNNGLDLALIGFIDDDPSKKGKRIHGYPVFGDKRQLEDVIRKNNIKEIVVSFRTNGHEKKKELSQLCINQGLDVTVQQMRLVINP